MDLMVKALLAILIIAVIVLLPFLLVWAINTLAEQGGAAFQIDYNFWSWLAALIFVAFMPRK